MTFVPTKPASDVFAPVTGGGAPRAADMGETQTWGIEVESKLSELDAAVGSANGYPSIIKTTYAGLITVTGVTAGQRGEVTGPDAGTHTDPVVGGVVDNIGIYSWSESPAGWQRVDDNDITTLQNATSVVFRNEFRYGTMDFGTLNPSRYGNSEVIALTTQRGLIDLGFISAVKQRTGGTEYAFQTQLANRDLRNKRGVVAMVVYSEDSADIAGISRPDMIISDGSTIQVTNYVAGGTFKQQLGPNTWLLASEVVFPNQSNATTQLWIGTETVPNTANRLLTGFYCYVSDGYQPAEPVILSLKAHWTARMLAREAIDGLDLLAPARKRRIITLQTMDKILVAGDSYMEALDALKMKGPVQMMAMLTDWNLWGYGVGGDDHLKIWKRLLDNVQNYGFGPQNIKPSDIFIISDTNDSRIKQVSHDYLDSDIARVTQLAKSIAGRVHLFTEHPALPSYVVDLKRQVARRLGAEFVDIMTEAALSYPTGTPDPNFYRGSHPGTRANTVLWSPITRYINEQMPRPSTGIKIFRRRSTYSVSAEADLLYETIPQRAERWEELATGGRGLNDTERVFFDDLDGASSTPANDIVTSEYATLAGSGTKTADDYLLVEVILPALGPDVLSVTIAMACDATALKSINRLAVPSFTGTWRWAFGGVAETAVPGAVYTDQDGINRTIVGQSGTTVIVSPDTSAATQSGTLTKVSGSGPATMAYTSSLPGNDPAYYTEFDKPRGAWTSCLLSISGGIVTGRINVNPHFHVQGDKMSFLFTKSGTITFGPPSITVDYLEDKPIQKPAALPKATGSELLTQTLMGEAGELASWTRVGTVTTVVPSGELPAGVTKVARITTSNYLYQAFTTPSGRVDPCELEITVLVRRWIALFNSAADFSTSVIRPETFDLAPFDIWVGINSGGFSTASRHTEWVGLGFQKIVRRFWLPGEGVESSVARRLWLRAKRGGDTFEVARASIKRV